jgi:hypothetical protein
MAFEVNSVPLSLTIIAGFPHLAMSASSSRATSKPRRAKGSKLGSDAILVQLRLFCAD